MTLSQRDELEAQRSKLADSVDSAFGIQPVMSHADLCATVERKANEMRMRSVNEILDLDREIVRLRESDRLLRAIVKAYQTESNRGLMRAVHKAQDALYPNPLAKKVKAFLANKKAAA